MGDRDGNVIGRDEVELFATQERAIGDDREGCSREAPRQRRDQPLDLGPVEKRFPTPKLNGLGRIRDPAIKLGQEMLDIGQLRDGGIRDLEGLTAIAAGVVARQAFELRCDCLSFEHNGRPFSEADILGITDVGEGTKFDDVDTIGRFGVGFRPTLLLSRHQQFEKNLNSV